MDELSKLVEEYDLGNNFGKRFLLDLFSKLRKSKISRPDIIAKEGKGLIAYSSSSSSGEIWSICEQVMIAALEIGDDDLVEFCKARLVAKFDVKKAGEAKSSRLERLMGMEYEAKGNFDAALGIYHELLKENPANLFVMKRKACALKGKGQMDEAIQALNDIITLYYQDQQTWTELAEIYIEVGDFSSAAFALEELIIISPLTVAYHTRLAEVLYSIGGVPSLIKARKHYAFSLNTQGSALNKRALFGIIATCKAILDETPAAEKKTLESQITTEMLEWARTSLLEQKEMADPKSAAQLSAIALA
jgi:ER membrane protein complex subunit 2